MRISDWSSDVCSSDLLVAGLLHHLGARVVVFVDPVPEAHEAEGIVLVLGALDKLGDAVLGADLGQHLQHRLVGAAVRRAPQRGDAGGDAGEGIGVAGTGRSEEHTSELQSLMRTSYAVFCLKK